MMISGFPVPSSIRRVLNKRLVGLAVLGVCALGLSGTVALAQPAAGLSIDDLTPADIAASTDQSGCATGYRRAYFFRDTPDTAPIVFVDRANSALIKLDGQMIELKSVAHLDREKDRSRSFAAPDKNLTVEQTFRRSKVNKDGKTITVLNGTIKVISKTETRSLRVVGTPGC